MVRPFAWVLVCACASNPSKSSDTTERSADLVPDPSNPQGGGPGEPCAAPIVLNEISPSNREVLFDHEGDSVDWIELANLGDTAVDLTGWSLSDDPDEPRKWSFPTATIAPGGLLLVYASGKGLDRPVVTWDTRIDLGDTWRYLGVKEPVDPGWMQPDFDDGAWESGPSGFGRSDEDDATEVGARTVYARTTFSVTEHELADLAALVLHVDFDDGFVAYVDGVEVARENMGAPGVPPAWDAYATDDSEAKLPQGLPPAEYDLTAHLGLITPGVHTLAVEAHDVSAESSDLSLVPILTLGFATAREGRDSVAVDFAPVGLHTNFELRSEGERLRLFDPDGCPADEAEPEPLLADESYGRQPDGKGPWVYFLEPTPGQPNTTEGRPGFAPTPTFDPPPGFHPAGVEVNVGVAADAVVRATFDGSDPGETDPEVDQPLPVEGEVMVLRARAFQDGLWPSRIATGTWLVREPDELPVISLVTDPANLWDDEIGIYAFGTDYDPELPYYGANFWEDWERPVAVEYWETDGSKAFASPAGIKIHGNWSRTHEQKNLVLDFDPGWGADPIEHEVFPDLGVTTFDRLLLRAGGNDWLGCFKAGCSDGANLRDGLMHRLTAGQDLDAMAYRPAEVYLNGVWWGIYEMREKPDLSYVAAHHGYTDIDLLEAHGVVVEGDDLAWETMLDFLRTHDLADPANYAQAEAMIDMEELATYFAFEVWFDNTDWPGNNIKYWRPRTPDGRWRWLLYDTDFGLGADGRNPEHDTLAFALDPAGPGWPNPPWSTELFRLVFASPTFETMFLQRYADLMNTNLHPDVTRAELAEVVEGIVEHMPRHVDRWDEWTDGVDDHDLDDGMLVWEEEVGRIDRWLTERPDHARAHVLAYFGLPGTFTLSLDASPPGSGTFQLAAVEVEGPFEGTYWQTVPVTITAVPAPGRTFVGWSDPSVPDDPTITIQVGTDRELPLVATFE